MLLIRVVTIKMLSPRFFPNAIAAIPPSQSCPNQGYSIVIKDPIILNRKNSQPVTAKMFIGRDQFCYKLSKTKVLHQYVLTVRSKPSRENNPLDKKNRLTEKTVPARSMMLRSRRQGTDYRPPVIELTTPGRQRLTGTML